MRAVICSYLSHTNDKSIQLTAFIKQYQVTSRGELGMNFSATKLDVILSLKSQLQFYLKDRGMTMAELSRKSGVPRQSLSQWAQGTTPRMIDQVKSVADVFNTSIDNLMYGSGLDQEREQVNDLQALLGDDWIGGLFEVRFRRVKKGEK